MINNNQYAHKQSGIPLRFLLVDVHANIVGCSAALSHFFEYADNAIIHAKLPSLFADSEQILSEIIKLDASSEFSGCELQIRALKQKSEAQTVSIQLSQIQLLDKSCILIQLQTLQEKNDLGNKEPILNAVLDNTVDGILTIDGDGKIISYNLACETIFGYMKDDVIGRNVNILMPEPYHSEHDSYLENYQTTGKKKIIGIGREVMGMHKDGTVFPLDLSVSHVKLENQTLYSGIVRDISERKITEERLLKSNKELERFAFIASHDLQEPLRMISNFAKLLEEEEAGNLSEEGNMCLDYVMKASMRMQLLVNDLLSYSRVDTEGCELSYIDPNKSMTHVLDSLSIFIENSQAKVDIDLPEKMIGNVVQFERLMQNLISNSLKYIAEGEVPHIQVSASLMDGYWKVSVGDNGIGIEEQYHERIFTIFERLHNKDEYSGTGIGLAICKKIVNSFGGRIWVESNLSSGSVFHFTVPNKIENTTK